MKKDTDNIAAKLSAIQPNQDRVPADWKTVNQLMDTANKRRQWVADRIKVGLQTKKVERKDFRILDPLGRLKTIAHYRFK